MPEMTMPLSVANIRSLRDDLKVFARRLREDIPAHIEASVADTIAAEVVANIANIQDVDGNYLGTDNPNASVVARPELKLARHEVVWSGKQITYVEFGTGAAGASGFYQQQGAMGAANYHPDPTKAFWYYKDRQSGEAELSHGLPPQAPMATAVLVARAIRLLPNRAADILTWEVNRAVTLR